MTGATMKHILYIALLVTLLTGCATELKAPCDEHATFCGTKTKINQW
jgi:hypothetical protein